MNIQTITYPYEDIVSYNAKKDRFSSFCLLDLFIQKVGEVSCEVSFRIDRATFSWRVGSLYCMTEILPKDIANHLRQWLVSEECSLLRTLQEEEQRIRKKYQSVSPLCIKKIEWLDENRGDSLKTYEQKVRVQFTHSTRFYPAYITKKYQKKTVTVRVKNMEEACWYPGWKQDVEKQIIEKWVSQQSLLLNPLWKRKWTNQ